ncbi:LPXTG cell wall anchor domain-containing protein [Parapedobacter sp. SGR-10]|uniref:LPXTG cell wall anchor domain-containing protein n=1 Tax=Parapedobacter sp. SGR-10 TaxID=2710879 RepID=UPI0013D249F4|nr:LPXTG cell wall anchor domain-containing protein [Parapedobacter sp. SGR-10]NGF57583.1 LPXTG cell wall anchor domain-containing protein [Parapedobacter sp. SGR-10]
MKPKTIIIAILLALVVIVLFYNKEESTFWLFGEIRTSKLIILGSFYLLGVITGGVLFRRRKKHPKEYGISNPNATETSAATTSASPEQSPYSTSNLSDEDRDFIRRD